MHLKNERGGRPEYRETVKTNNEPAGGTALPAGKLSSDAGIVSSNDAIVKAPGSGRRTDQQFTNTNK